MVAVIAGNGLGLDNSSLTQLGQGTGGQAGVGQTGTDQYLNIATGNLVLRDPGQSLVFDGTSLDMLRTYNSQGQLSGDNGWLFGFQRNIGTVTGTVNTAGSTVTRTADDGSVVVYAYDSVTGDYVSQGQGGTDDRLHWDAAGSSWRWTDGASHIVETYDTQGKLASLSNPQTGASFTFTWQDGRLAEVLAGDGDRLSLDYDASGHLTSLTIAEVPPGGTDAVVRQHATYGYDTQGRLVTVSTALTSDTTAGGGLYTTTYTYDGNSDRLASMTQGDGTTVAYTYSQDAEGNYRVSGIVTGSGADAQATTVAYGADSTTITDALGHAWTYGFSADGRLTSITAPAVNGAASVSRYEYDAEGNLTRMTDANGGVTHYSYDAHGNLTAVESPAGDTTSYTYDAADQMLTRTVYAVAAQGEVGSGDYVAPSGAQTTHYVYDSEGHLAYVVDPLGTVTRRGYTTDAQGNTVLSSTFVWRDVSFSPTGTEPTVADLASWEGLTSTQAHLQSGSRVDYTYDVRGQLSSQTAYDLIDAAGNGVSSSGTVMTRTTYDASGRLLQSATVRGQDRDVVETTSYAYDGLGRVVSVTDALGHATSYVYLDHDHAVEMIDAAGLTTTRVWNSAGLLISSTQSSGAPLHAGDTFYDTAGRPVVSVDAQGKATYTFYDASGRISGIIDPAGKLVAKAYDTDGNLLSTIAYANTVDTTGWLGTTGPTATLPTNTPVPVADSADQIALNVYDAQGRILAAVSSAGAVVVTTRDAHGNVVSTRSYAAHLSASVVQSLGMAPTIGDVLAAVSPTAQDVRSLAVYDADDLPVVTVDDAGVVTLYMYDDAGRVRRTNTYSIAITAASRDAMSDAPTEAEIVAAVPTQAKLIPAIWIRASDGRILATVDPAGVVTLYTYIDGELAATTTLANTLTVTQVNSLGAEPTYDDLLVADGIDPQHVDQNATITIYDDAGHAVATVKQGKQVLMTYDDAGNVASSTTYYNYDSSLMLKLAKEPTLAHLMDLLSGSSPSESAINIYDAEGNVAAQYHNGTLTYTGQAADDSWKMTADYDVSPSQWDSLGENPSLGDVAALIQGVRPANIEKIEYFNAQGVKTASFGTEETQFANVYDSEGHLITSMTGPGGPSVWDVLGAGNVPKTYEDVVQNSLAMFSNYAFFDAAGSRLATVTVAYTYRWDDGYGYHPTVTLTDTDADRNIAVDETYTSAMTQHNFYDFATHPTIDALIAAIDMSPETGAVTYTNDAGEVVAVARYIQYLGSSVIDTYAYDSKGRQVRDTEYYVPLYFGGMAADMPSLETVMDAIGTDEGATTYTIYADDASGSTRYQVQNGEVDVVRYGLDGHTIATASYEPALSEAAMATLAADPSGGTLIGLLEDQGSQFTDLDVVATNLPYYYVGQLSFVSEEGPGIRIVSSVAVQPDEAMLLQLFNTGDASPLLSLVAGAGQPDVVSISLADSQGRPLAVVSSSGSEFWSYAADGRITAHTQGPGIQSGLSALGTNPTPAALRAAATYYYNDTSIYDDRGNEVASIASDGSVQTHYYDDAGRLISTVLHDVQLTPAQVAELARSPSMLALTVDLSLADGGHIDQSLRDANGHVVATIDGDGNVRALRYDSQGRVIAVTDYATPLPAGFGLMPSLDALYAEMQFSSADRTTLTIYDGMGHPAATIEPDGTLTVTTYGAAGIPLDTIRYAQPLTRQQIASMGREPTLVQVLRMLDGRTSRVVYDQAGRLTATIDQGGFTTFTFYDAQDRVTGQVDARGALTTYVYDANGAVTASTTFATPVDISSWYDRATGVLTIPTAQPTVSASVDDRTTLTLRDASGRIAAQVDATGVVTRLSYDGESRVVASTVSALPLDADERDELAAAPSLAGLDSVSSPSSLDRTSRTIYDAAGHPAISIDPAGYVTVRSFDGLGNVTMVRQYAQPLNAANLTAIDLSTDLPTVTGMLTAGVEDLVTRAFYDATGRETASIDEAGFLTTWAYDEQTHLQTSTRHALALSGVQVAALAGDETAQYLISLLADDANAQTVSDTYDSLGELVDHIDVAGAETQYTYDAMGRQTGWSTSDTYGNYSGKTGYDAFGDVISTTNGVGDVTTSVWDENGRKVSTTDAAGNTTWYIYDRAGQVAYQVAGRALDDGTPNARGEVTSFSYDAFGDLTQKRTYLSLIPLTTAYEGDDLNPEAATATSLSAWLVRVGTASTADPVVQYTYTGVGQLASMIDGEGYATLYAYDAFGEQVSVTQQVSGNHEAVTVSNSVTTSYAYDVRGERVAVMEAVGTSLQRSTATAYDAFGRATSVTDPSGHVTSYEYDRLGRQISLSQSIAGVLSRSSTTYDAFGRTVTQTDAMGHVTRFSYDVAARSMTVTTPEGVAMTTVHDSLGDVVAITDADGNTTQYTYDGAGRLVQTRDALGAVDTVTYEQGGAVTHFSGAHGESTVSYDGAGRVLTRVFDPQGADLVTTYTYDGAGRVVSQTDPLGQAYFTYDGDGRLVQSTRSSNVSGNLAGGPFEENASFIYDGLGRVTVTTLGVDPFAETTRYDFDALGRRVAQTVDPSGLALTTNYEYDAEDHLVRIVDPLGLSSYTIYDEAGRLIYSLVPTGSVGSGKGILTHNTYDGDGNLVASTTYATAVDTASLSTSAGQAAGVLLAAGAALVPLESVNDSSAYVVRDEAGRVHFAIDSQGIVTETRYNALGQISVSLVYPQALSLSGNLATLLHAGAARPDDVATALQASGDGADAAQAAYSYYDADGRIAFVVHAEEVNGVRLWMAVGTTYTDDGQVRTSTVYASPLAEAELEGGSTTDSISVALSGQVADGTARVTTYVYDQARRHIATIGPDGAQSFYIYGESGKVEITIDEAWGTTFYVYDSAGRVFSERRLSVATDTTGWLEDGEPSSQFGQNVAYMSDNDTLTETLYDETGRVIQVSHALYSLTEWGTSWAAEAYEYDAAGREIAEVDTSNPNDQFGLIDHLKETAQQRTTRYFYDAGGNRIGVLDAAGTITVNQFDAGGQVVATTTYATATELGKRVRGTLDQLVPVTSDDDQTTVYFRDDLGHTLGSIDAAGYLTTFAYDTAGHVVESARYATKVPITSRTDLASALSDVGQGTAERTSAVYDAIGRLLSSVNAEGTETTYRYDLNGHLVQTVVAAGTDDARSTSYEYDALSQMSGQTDASGARTSYTYDMYGRVNSTTDALGNTTWSIYDGGNLSYTIRGIASADGSPNAFGEVTDLYYDGRGNLTERRVYAEAVALPPDFDGTFQAVLDLIPPSGWPTDGEKAETFQYDGMGNVTYYNGATTYTASYDGFGELVYRTNGYRDYYYTNGTLDTEYAYDAVGHVVRRSDFTPVASSGPVYTSGGYGAPINRVQTWTYDALGRNAAYVDGNGSVTNYAYDALDDQVGSSRVVDGSLRETEQQFDAFGRLISRTDALGLVTTFVYDDAARTIVTTFPDGLTTTATHNREGQQVKLVDQVGGTTAYTYDVDGRLTDTERPDGTHLGAVYDVLGNITRSTDASGTVVEYTYDAAGRVLTQTVDPDGLRLVTTHTYNGVGLEIRMVDAAGAITAYQYNLGGVVSEMTVIRGDAPAGSPPEQDVTYGYDNDGNLNVEYFWDAGGVRNYLEEYRDPFGNLIRSSSGGVELRYAYDANGNLRMSSDGRSNTYYAYNEANQLIWKLTPATTEGGWTINAVTGYTYDVDGNLLSTTQYAASRSDDSLSLFRDGHYIDWNVYQPLTGAEAAAELSMGGSSDDRTSYRVYDALGRLQYEIGPQGMVTETRYDALQRPVQTLAYSHPIAIDEAFALALSSGEATPSAVAAALAAGGNSDDQSRAVRSWYDDFGKLLFTVTEAGLGSARAGIVTEFHYDADGRVISTLTHDAKLTAAQLAMATTASLSAWAISSPEGVGSRSVYDAAGRLVFVIDENGFVQHNVLDGDGRVVSSYTYANPIGPVSWSEDDVAAAVAAANPHVADVRGTDTQYDARGNVLSVTRVGNSTPDAAYTYDQLNNKTSYTNADGETWTYAYDSYGLLLSETSPSVAVVDTSGPTPVTVTGPIVTSYDHYDGTSRITGTTVFSPSGRQTHTSTEYDPSGNVISQSSSGGTVDVDSGEIYGSQDLTVNSRYNIFGDLVSTVDANGNASYKVYDHAGRLAYDIDTEGYATGYAYDAYGELTGTTRYATALDIASITGGDPSAAPDIATVQANLVTASADRWIHTEYDAFGHKTQVTQAPVSYAHADGSLGTASPVTRFTYDARGRVTSTSTLVDGTADQPGAVWATTFNWYDAEGHQTLSVDPMGYVTAWSYNGFGDVTSQAEYATPIATGGLAAGGSLPATPAANGADRVTTYTYDALGRKATESTLRDYVDAAGNPIHGYVTTTYGYDREDRVTSVSEGGRTIVTSYDALGRITSVTAPAERVLVSNWKALLQANPSWDLNNDALYTSSAQLVTYGYDGAGNKTVQTQGSTASGATQSTWYRYDQAGRMVASVSPLTGVNPQWDGSDVSYFIYDGAGHVVTSVSRLTDKAGDGSQAKVTTSYTFDALGRQTSVTVQRSNASTPDSASTTAYNVFGEVVLTGNGVASKSSSAYDAAGRLTSTIDPATGVQHTYTYDLAGNLIQDTSHATGGSEVFTRYTRDLDGHVLSQLTPSTTSASGESATAQQATYDRWGNVLSATDARGNTTVYTYNERNQLVSTSGPQVSAVDDSGNASAVAPVKTTAYDVDGNVVAVTDENGNVTRTVYDAAGQVVDVIDGAGAHTRVAYDSLGHEVAGQTGSAAYGTLHVTFKDVDAQGRVVAEGDFVTPVNGSAWRPTNRQTYILDEAGNRVIVYDGLGSEYLQAGDADNAALHANYYAYDSQGRVIRSQDGAQRAASNLDPSDFPPPVQQPRNLDLKSGDVAWAVSPASQASSWTYANGTYVYAGSTDDTIHLVNQDRVPVVPGQTISAWADLWSTGSHGGSGVDILWYDVNDNLIGDSGGNVQTTDDGRGRSVVTATASSNAAYARIAVGASNSSNSSNKTTFYGSGWDYTPPNGVESPILDGSIFVNLPPGTFSLQPLNPDFENGDSGWQKDPGWSIVQADNTANGKWIGSYTGSTVGTMVNQNRAPVLPGQKITAKARITLDQRNGAEPAGALLIMWYDASGNLIRYNSSNVITDGNGGTFQDVSVTDVAPEGAAYATVALSGNGNGGGAAVFDAVSWDYRYVPSVDPGLIANSFTYDVDGNLVAQTNADGDTESWVRDAYGRVTDHVDLSGASYHYTYDAYSGLQLTESDNWAGTELAGQSKPGYVSATVGTTNSETRTYNAAGQVTGITYADGSSYTYAYDANGNQVRQEATTVDGNNQAVHTVTTTTYDSHNRIDQVVSNDGKQVLTETYTYDAAGNRRSITANVVANGTQISATTSWYAYDGDNRVSVSDGDLVNGAITVSGRSTSYGVGHDDVGNIAWRMTKSGSSFMRQVNAYDARGQLVRAMYAVDMSTNTSRGVAETRTYDNNGNVVTDDQYYMLGTTANQRYNPKLDPDSPSYIGGGAGTTPGADIGGMLSTATITRYDSYGRVDAEQTFGHDQYWDGTGGDNQPDPLPAADATSWSGMSLTSAVLYQGPGNSSAYDAMGNVVFYQYRTNSNRLDQYTVTYLKKEGYLESATSGQNVSNLANVRPATDESYYNARGERIAIAQHTQYAYGSVADTVRAFAYDGNGQIISRRDGTANGNAIDQGSDPGLKNQHYVYVNGQQIAHYDEKSTVDVLSQVTAFSSGNGTGDYVVQEGDTLKSIAQAVYGNASLWYIVAQANALGGDADLAVGLSLSIPAVTTSQNDATTFKPYNPSEIQGSTQPDLPVIAPPPPPPKAHCNVIAAVIVIAVIVVATIVTVGAAAGLGSVAAAAIGGAAGSAAGQLAGDALGVHQGFSFGEVFTSAATAAVTAGVGNYLSTGSAFTSAVEVGGTAASSSVTAASDLGFGGRAIQAGAGYVTQDVAGKLAGQDEHFSWAGLLSTSLAAGAAGYVGPTQSQVQAGQAGAVAWRTGTASLLEGTVQREASSALGDHEVSSWQGILENAVGRYVGTAVGNTVQVSASARPQPRADQAASALRSGAAGGSPPSDTPFDFMTTSGGTALEPSGAVRDLPDLTLASPSESSNSYFTLHDGEYVDPVQISQNDRSPYWMNLVQSYAAPDEARAMMTDFTPPPPAAEPVPTWLLVQNRSQNAGAFFVGGLVSVANGVKGAVYAAGNAVYTAGNLAGAGLNSLVGNGGTLGYHTDYFQGEADDLGETVAHVKTGVESLIDHPVQSVEDFATHTADELGSLAGAAGTDNQSEANLRFLQLGERTTDVLQLVGGAAALGKLGAGVATGGLVRVVSEPEALVGTLARDATGEAAGLRAGAEGKLVPNTTADVNIVGDAASATNPGRVTVYRVEGSPNQRLLVDDAGNVSIAPGNNSTIWLNFGETGRATDYLSTKVAQGLPDAQLKSFEIDPAFLEQVQNQAVPEQFARSFPSRPIISADPFPNQFGVRQNQFQQLLDSIYQGSGKNVPPGGN